MAQQKAYKIIVGTDSLQVSKGVGNTWQTDKIVSNEQLITYKGQALKPFTKYFWTVIAWDNNDKMGAKTPISTFETGMMQARNWQGAWISDSRDVQNKVAPILGYIYD